MLPFFSVITTIFKLKRTCPKCGRDQVVKPSRKDKTVPCKFCNASIPPKREK